MQKKLLPEFIPPRIVKGSRWFITWYETNPQTGALDRFRKTFSLNRIKNKAQRAERARAILQDVAQALAAGGFIYAGQDPAGQPYTPLGDALALALEIKLQSDSRDTRNTYRSIGKIFRAWIDQEKLSGWPVIRFGRREAMAFLDHIRLRRRVGETTYNNYLICLKALFNELKARDYIQQNPWDKIPKLRKAQKRRRNFSQQERQAVAAWIAANDPGLFLGILFTYYCFIRPNELRQMQIGCIDLAGKVIRLPAEITKTNRDRTVTIPAALIPHLGEVLQAHPASWHLFGRDLRPGRRPCGKNAFNRAHRKALEEVYRLGGINTLQGLSFYSWKDSGLTDMAENIPLYDLMKQAGHQDPKITLKYIHEKPAENIRRLKNKIF